MSADLLVADGLCRSYGSLPAVDGVDLRVPPGGRHGLIGPNGAGKTTLLDLLAGSTRPDRGRISFAGRDVTRLGAVRRARCGIGRTHQRPAVWPSDYHGCVQWAAGAGDLVEKVGPAIAVVE